MTWAEAVANLSREINTPRSLEERLDTVIRVAQSSMDEIDHVGISMIRRDGRIETMAATDDFVLQLDTLLYDNGDGPCMQALREHHTVLVEDARHEQRWPGFIPDAVRLGLRSQLGIRLNADEHTAGAFNLYSTSSDTISDETIALAELFASHAALTLGHVKQVNELSQALATRTTIGTAIGILMHRLDLDADTAFAYLTRLSATSETKLRIVAENLVKEQVEHSGRNKL